MIKKIYIFTLSISLLIASCSSDDNQSLENNTTITNGFLFNNEEHTTPFVSKTLFDNHYQLTFADKDFTTGTYSGSLNFIGILFQSTNGEITPGTYTFLSDTDQNFNSSKNFFDAESGIDLKVTNGEADLSSGYFEDIISGTITIEKENNTYNITYSLSFTEGTFEGNYSGAIKNSEEITPPSEASLLGKWQLVSQFQEGSNDISECELMDTLEFKENGDSKNIYHYLSVVRENGEIVSSKCTTYEELENKWTLDVNKITFTNNTDTHIGTILELNETTLTLEFENAGIKDTYTYKRLKSDKDLIIGKWKVIYINDLPYDDCELLSTLDIKSNGIYEDQTYGGTHGLPCSPDALQSGTWSLDGTTFYQIEDGTTFSNTILELSETTLRLTFEHDNGDGTSLTEIWMYTK